MNCWIDAPWTREPGSRILGRDVHGQQAFIGEEQGQLSHCRGVVEDCREAASVAEEEEEEEASDSDRKGGQDDGGK